MTWLCRNTALHVQAWDDRLRGNAATCVTKGKMRNSAFFTEWVKLFRYSMMRPCTSIASLHNHRLTLYTIPKRFASHRTPFQHFTQTPTRSQNWPQTPISIRKSTWSTRNPGDLGLVIKPMGQVWCHAKTLCGDCITVAQSSSEFAHVWVA
jgi:hypothetical protein